MQQNKSKLIIFSEYLKSVDILFSPFDALCLESAATLVAQSASFELLQKCNKFQVDGRELHKTVAQRIPLEGKR